VRRGGESNVSRGDQIKGKEKAKRKGNRGGG
jgi:hypothetical protein